MTISFDGNPLDVPVTWATANSTVALGATVYGGPARAGFGAVEVQFQAAMVRKARLLELIVVTSTAQPAGGSLVFTLRVNGAPSTLTITIAAGTGAGTFRDATHIVAVALADLVSVQLVNNDGGNPSAAVVSIGFILRSSPV